MIKGAIYMIVSLALSWGPVKADLKNYAMTAAVILGTMAVAEMFGSRGRGV